MKKILGLLFFAFGAGMAVMFFCRRSFFMIVIVVLVLLIGYHLFCCDD